MLGLMELGALGFAAARGTQLIVHDSILDDPREYLEMWHARKFNSGFRTFVRDLLSCIWCTGFHLSWVTVLVYLLATGSWGEAPFLVHGIEVFAVAGIQGAINTWLDGGTH